MSLLLSAIPNAIRKRFLHDDTLRAVQEEEDSNQALFTSGEDDGLAALLKLADEGGGLSQWQVLHAKILAIVGNETAPDETEVRNLLKGIVKERLLADQPEFSKYFKTEAGGRAMEDRVLRKAAAEAEAAGWITAPSSSDATAAPAGVHPAAAKRRPRWWDGLARGLARYRCWRPRVQVYLTLSRPDYSPLAFVVGAFMMAIILLNTVTFCLESVPDWEGSELLDRLTIVDYVCLGIFTVEFLLRLATCSSFRRFASSFMNWVDLAAIAPFYVELAVAGPGSSEASQSRIVRLLRLLRVLRLLRATSRFRNLQVVVDSLAASFDVIVMLAVLLLVLLVVSATIIYYVEGALVPNTWFDSIPLSIYYMHVTLTTTGYGDFYPLSAWGRFTAGVFMLLCLVTMSLPIGVVGGNFSALWSRFTAIRDSLDRSSAAWATRGHLRGLAVWQCNALDDLVAAVNRLKCAVEDGSLAEDERMAGMKEVQERLVGLRTRMRQTAAGGGELGKVAELRNEAELIRGQLAESGGSFAALQDLLSVSGRLSSPELRDQLDKMAAVHKDMAAWAGGGAAAAVAARGLLGELRALRQLVQTEEEWAAGAGGGGGPDK